MSVAVEENKKAVELGEGGKKLLSNQKEGVLPNKKQEIYQYDVSYFSGFIKQDSSDSLNLEIKQDSSDSLNLESSQNNLVDNLLFIILQTCAIIFGLAIVISIVKLININYINPNTTEMQFNRKGCYSLIESGSIYKCQDGCTYSRVKGGYSVSCIK